MKSVKPKLRGVICIFNEEPCRVLPVPVAATRERRLKGLNSLSLGRSLIMQHLVCKEVPHTKIHKTHCCPTSCNHVTSQAPEIIRLQNTYAHRMLLMQAHNVDGSTHQRSSLKLTFNGSQWQLQF